MTDCKECERLKAENARLAEAVELHKRFTGIVAHHPSLWSSPEQDRAKDALKDDAGGKAIRDLLAPTIDNLPELIRHLRSTNSKHALFWTNELARLRSCVPTAPRQDAQAFFDDMKNWVCPKCGQRANTEFAKAEWRWNGRAWEHSHEYPIGHVQAERKPLCPKQSEATIPPKQAQTPSQPSCCPPPEKPSA